MFSGGQRVGTVIQDARWQPVADSRLTDGELSIEVQTFGGKYQVFANTARAGCVELEAGGMTVEGDFAPEALQRALARDLDRVEGCYEAALLQTPTLSGELNASLRITRGDVTNVEFDGGTFAPTNIETCLAKHFAHWKFHPHATATVVFRLQARLGRNTCAPVLGPPRQATPLRSLDTGPVARLALSPDGKQLVTGHGGGGLDLWELSNGKMRRLRTPSTPDAGRWSSPSVLALAMSPQGGVAVALSSLGGYDRRGSLEIWDAVTRQRLAAREVPYLAAVAFTDGGVVGLSQEMDLIHLNRPDAGPQPIGSLDSPVAAYATFASDARAVAVAYAGPRRTMGASPVENVLLWDIEQQRILGRAHGEVNWLGLDPSGAVLACGPSLLQARTRRELDDAQLPSCFGVQTLDNLEVTGLGEGSADAPSVKTPRIRRLSPRNEIIELGSSDIHCSVLSPDRKLLVTCDPDNRVRVWNRSDLPIY